MRESNLKRRNYNFDNNGETIALGPNRQTPATVLAKCTVTKSQRPGCTRSGLQRIYHLNTSKPSVFTIRLHFLPHPYVAAQFRKTFLIFFEQCTCLFLKSLLESLSIPTVRLPPKTRRVWINGATRGPLDKRWIPEPESRAFPKTPDQRSLRESPAL